MTMTAPPRRSRRKADQIDDGCGLFRRQPGARFVEQQDAGLGQKRHGEFEDLLLAVGQFAGLAGPWREEWIARAQSVEHTARPALEASGR